MTYIYDRTDWPAFRWDDAALSIQLASVRHNQGRLLGRMMALGFPLQADAAFQTLVQDVLQTSEIEGEHLDPAQVRSSLSRHLGREVPGLVPVDHHVDGVVAMLLDATRSFDAPLTAERLFGWHEMLFPTAGFGRHPITIGAWRTDALGPMRVVSGRIGRERIHFQAPPAIRVPEEMAAFLAWFEDPDVRLDPVIKAALAHIWFVTIHPFDDGNGRIGRAIADLALARGEGTSQRFYSISARLRIERNAYYETLEATQKGDLDITQRLAWFLTVLDGALSDAEATLAAVIRKGEFWRTLSNVSLNDRQRMMLNRLLDGFTGKLTSSKWASIAKCSQDTALRDLDDLIERGLLVRGEAGGRSTSYLLVGSP